MKEKLKNVFFRVWYWYVSTVDKNAEVIFMNYGYSKDNHKIKLDENDEKNRYSAQLYNLVATGADIKGKDILEVGCGRGGGLSYINRYLSPNSVTGVDLNKKAIEFCKKHYSNERIKFLQANAQSLNFQDNAFDVVINVESSHRYSQMDKFLDEVYRVLKPGGVFLFADFRHEIELEGLNTQLKNSNFIFFKDEKITANVLEALKLSTSERENLIHKIVPKFLHGLGKKFAATEGTPTYNKFLTQEFEYLFCVLMKRPCTNVHI
ncbi:MAG: class I SAM-dependent methyltransferase [Bacteroidales bacterium]|nr:class I SAM-dependent methyltransferase [Bacteroidales bacterium]